MGSLQLLLTFIDFLFVWRRCSMALSACTAFYGYSSYVHWALFAIVVHNFIRSLGWSQVQASWCSSWLYFLLIEVIFFITANFFWWVHSQRQLYLCIIGVITRTLLVIVQFCGLTCLLECTVVLESRVSCMVFPVRLLYILLWLKKSYISVYSPD